MMRSVVKKIARGVGLRRTHVAAARMYAERFALATTPPRRKRNGGRILCYHSIGQPELGVNDVTPEQFRGHIELALKAGYRFVPPSQLALGGGTANDLAITFDDALKTVLTQGAPILKDYGIPWTVFVVSEWTEQTRISQDGSLLSWSDLERLSAEGVEIGSHSATHPDFGKIGEQETADELVSSRRKIEERLGFAPASFAIPLGQSMNWPPAAHEAAKKAGYELIYAQAEVTRPQGTIPRTFVTKFDGARNFNALLRGAYDRWEEWI